MVDIARKKKLSLFFLRKKPSTILIALKKDEKSRYASVLAKEADCTYSHTVRILQELERRKLIEFDKKGRIKMIKLTKLGEDVADCLERLVRLFEKADEL